MTQPRRQPTFTLDMFFSRLASELSRLLNSGSITERKLASDLGISQPHLHNILSGRRKLTATIAGQVLERMGWNVLDLLEAADLKLALERRNPPARVRQIPLSDFGAGPGVVFPGPLDGEHPVPISWLSQATRPAVVALRPDLAMAPVLAGGDLLVVDQGQDARQTIGANDYYVVRQEGSSLVRRLRETGRGVYLLSERHLLQPLLWPHVDCPPGSLPDVVQAKVIAWRRPPDGTFQSLARQSGAS